MGNSYSLHYTSFEFYSAADIIINTLPEDDQACLIEKTTPAADETARIEALIAAGEYNKKIVVYGYNCADTKPEKKARQLAGLGFSNVQVYRGGLFEWLLLQDIYGSSNFPTTSVERDIMRFSSCGGAEKDEPRRNSFAAAAAAAARNSPGTTPKKSTVCF
jgi:hypothetical protein